MEPDIFWIPKKGISVKKIEKWQNWTKITNRRKKRRTRYNGDNKEKNWNSFLKKINTKRKPQERIFYSKSKTHLNNVRNYKRKQITNVEENKVIH